MPITNAPAVRDQIRTWEVGPGLAQLYALYSRALNTSVAQRCVATITDDEDQRTRAELLLARAAESTWTTPGLTFAHHAGLTGAVNASGPGWVMLELEAALAQDRPPPTSTDQVSRSEPWVRYALTALERRHRDDRDDWTLQVAAPSERDRSTAAEALALLELAWPSLAVASRDLVRVLVWFHASDRGAIRSGSVAEAHGAVFVPADSRLVALVHALVREVSHLDVVMRTAVDKLIVNGRDRVPEVTRHYARTLGDTLDGAVAAARVSWAMDRCGAFLRGRDREDAVARGDEARARLGESIGVLTAGGHFTSAGETLLDSVARR